MSCLFNFDTTKIHHGQRKSQLRKLCKVRAKKSWVDDLRSNMFDNCLIHWRILLALTLHGSDLGSLK
jgi:hypothetical protein